MIANNTIERAEKYRSLGRFDKKSALFYLNDGLYFICNHQSLKVREVREFFNGMNFKPRARLIKINSIEVPDRDDIKYQVNQNNTIDFFLLKDGKWERVTFEDNLEERIILNYVGFYPFEELDDEIDFPEEFETALIYYLRCKMLEEQDDLERSQFFFGQFLNELRLRGSAKQQVISKPSDYSLR